MTNDKKKLQDLQTSMNVHDNVTNIVSEKIIAKNWTKKVKLSLSLTN
jgi:hypothetical protein